MLRDHKRWRMAGFTLMELLIALSLFSVIVGILISSFFQFQQQSSRMESILELRQELRILEQIIRNDLQSAIYLEEFMTMPPKEERDGRKSGIYGIDDAVGDHKTDQIHLHVKNRSRFHRNLSWEEDPRLHEVSYFLEMVDNEQFRFKRREEFYIDTDMTEGERSITHTLSTKVVSFNVEYYQHDQEETLDEWDSSASDIPAPMPVGLNVSLEMRNEQGEQLSSSMQINLRPYMGDFASWR